MSELDFHVRVQCVGVLSIGYCLTRDLITKAQRQSGRQVWQAAVPEQARQSVWAQTHSEAHQHFLRNELIQTGTRSVQLLKRREKLLLHETARPKC